MTRILLILAAIFLHGCAIIPDSIRPELQHMSHTTQHFGASPTNYGVNTAELMAHWDFKPIHAYAEAGEGIALTHASGCAQYQDQGYGEIIGPREQFIARVGFVIPVK